MNYSFIIMMGFFVLGGGIIILAVMIKNIFLKSFFFSVVSGIGALLALHFTSLITSISVPVHWLSICTCALGGLPAVAAMLAMQYM